MNKVMKISKVLNTIIRIARTLLKVAAIITAVAVVILMFVSSHQDIWSKVGYTLQLGEVTLDLIPNGLIPPETSRLLGFGSLVLSIVLFLLGAKWLQIVQSILTPMAEGRPFDASVSGSLRKLSFVTLIVGGIGQILNMVFFAIQLHSIQLSNLFNPEYVAGYTVENVMDTNFLIVFGVLLLMSHVFRYGEALQQLSDETL